MEIMSTYSENIRYQLAKQQLEQSFLKWVSQDNVHSFVNKLIGEVKNPTSNILSPPAPIFINKVATPLSPKTNGGSGMSEFGRSPHTPPRSPSAGDKWKTIVNPTFEPIENEEEKDFGAKTMIGDELTRELKRKKKKIPKFYYVGGKPVDEEVAKENMAIIEEIYGAKTELEYEEFQPI